MLPRSQHPAAFWESVADRLIKDRRRLGCDPGSPVAPSALDWSDAFKLLDCRNQEAIYFEMIGKVDQALILYEAGVADHFPSVSPYDRLRRLYTERDWHRDALQVCMEYLAQPEQPGIDRHDYFRAQAIQLTQRLMPRRL